MTTLTREHIERAMQHAVDHFQTNDRHRTAYLVGYLVAALDLDVELANRFLRQRPELCD